MKTVRSFALAAAATLAACSAPPDAVETDDANEVFWAIFHSHVRSPAVPSPTDIQAAQYPEALYILVSLAESQADPVTGQPSVRGWRIVDDAAHEVELAQAD